MKISLLAFFVVFLSLNTYASVIYPPDSTNTLVERGQAKYLISEGKKQFNLGMYRSALVKFREALVKDKNNPEATMWVGECHTALGNYDRGLKYALKAYKLDSLVHKEINYLLGFNYHKLGELDKAIENYNKAKSIISEARAKDLRIPLRIEECKTAKEMMNHPIKINIKALGVNVNTKNDEYSAVLSNSGKVLYFTSRRADNKGGGISSGDKKFFSDIYVSVWNSEKEEWGEATNLDDVIKKINTVGFDAVSAISSDGEYIYISINTDGLNKPKPKTRSTDIFYSKWSPKGAWGTPKPLQKKTINTMFFEAGASFTADGNTMYFVSERLGGEGMSDIWKSTKIGKKTWSKPVNLGSTINTPSNETTVYVTPDEKYLFFSSQGHSGMGGYDVYYCVKDNLGNWSKPVNMGYPINTVGEETHFQYYPKYKKAYYSKISKAGDGNGGVGGRDIFEVDMSDYKFVIKE
ncbi:MAG TPA: tetratricopeptide repeat protein [Crocinitomix sp.]|nr:tetratricopeptide repeat protein [Crocinitomix sp.]